MFTYRAWYFQHAKSICPDCSKGCNIEVNSLKQYVRRLRPRENIEVNGWWMCDHGRHDYHYINDARRIIVCKSGGAASMNIQEVTNAAGEKLLQLAKANPSSVAGLASAWLTLEEMYTFKQLFTEALGSLQIGLIAQAPGKEEIFPKFKIEGDKNPNSAGAKLVFGAGAADNFKQIVAGINAGTIKALYILSGMPHFTPPPELLEALPKLEYLIVQDLFPGPLTEKAAVVLPASSFAEKDGVFVNTDNRAQVVRRAIDPLGHGHDDLSILQRVLRGAGAADAKLISAREVFRRMAENIPELNGLTHQVLGEKGKALASR
jgi:predicted molibdopterin-dependent oxidoreductase YjgC